MYVCFCGTETLRDFSLENFRGLGTLPDHPALAFGDELPDPRPDIHAALYHVFTKKTGRRSRRKSASSTQPVPEKSGL